MPPNHARSAYRRIRNSIRVHLIPDLGRTQLAKLTSEQLARWLAKKRDATSLRTGKLLSPTTVRYQYTVLHVALSEAVRLGLLARKGCTSCARRSPRRRSRPPSHPR